MNNILLNILVVILTVTVVNGCNKKEKDYDQLKRFFDSNYQVKELDRFEKIIVVNEMGNCMDCNNSFVRKVIPFITNPHYLFLISGKGAQVDISKFRQMENRSVLFDPQNAFGELALVNSCAIIEIGKQKVDTIIAVSSENLSMLEFSRSDD